MELLFEAIKDRDIVVSPIEEVTEPPTEVSTPAITPVPDEQTTCIEQEVVGEIEPEIREAIETEVEPGDEPGDEPGNEPGDEPGNEPGDEDVPLPKRGAYQFDFDKFDDPNFNPFETKTKVVNAFDEPKLQPPQDIEPEAEPGDDFDEFNIQGKLYQGTRCTFIISKLSH